MKNIVIFASGSGSNAEKIIQHFKNNRQIQVSGIYSNNVHAKVLERAKNHNIPSHTFTKEQLNDTTVEKMLTETNPDLIVLAGFLLKFPEHLVKKYPNKIVNIHPALLPNYGGKGMYGMRVHEAVLANKETQTGITIHYVNEHYDEGAIIFQQTTNIVSCTTANQIAEKVHALEHEFFPIVIEQIINK